MGRPFILRVGLSQGMKGLSGLQSEVRVGTDGAPVTSQTEGCSDSSDSRDRRLLVFFGTEGGEMMVNQRRGDTKF
jgi:hypothetical protein